MSDLHSLAAHYWYDIHCKGMVYIVKAWCTLLRHVVLLHVADILYGILPAVTRLINSPRDKIAKNYNSINKSV